MSRTIDRFKLILYCWTRDLSPIDCLGKCFEYGYVTTTRHIEGIYMLEDAQRRHHFKEQKANDHNGYMLEPETTKERHHG